MRQTNPSFTPVKTQPGVKEAETAASF